MGERIDIPTLDGGDSFSAYLARPAGAPKAAIIVIQEIFGVNPGIRAKCDAWAEAGYLAVAPDLFWRIERDIVLDPDVEDEMKRAFGYIGQFDPDLGVLDIEATIRAARAGVDGGKVGIVGFCLGGRMAFLAAARTDIDASVGYYGGGIDKLLGGAHAIAKPLLLHFAELDHFITAEVVADIRSVLDTNGHVTIHEYAGVDHGFATTSGKRRSEEAAQLADGRSATFFAEHLK